MKLKSGVISYTKAGIILKRAFHAYIKILLSRAKPSAMKLRYDAKHPQVLLAQWKL